MHPESKTGGDRPASANTPRNVDEAILAELQRIRRAMEAGRSEAVGSRDAAALCGVSKPTWDRMNAAGKVPRPVRLMGSVRWLRAELMAWLEAGAPDRDTWERSHPQAGRSTARR